MPPNILQVVHAPEVAQATPVSFELHGLDIVIRRDSPDGAYAHAESFGRAGGGVEELAPWLHLTFTIH